MSPNPLSGRRRRAERVEAVYQEHGWGPLLSWPVPRSQGKPLVFALRVPTGVELIDIETLVQAAGGAPASLGEGADALRQGAAAAGAFLIAAICNVPAQDKPREVAATLTVALGEVEGPPDVEELRLRDSPSTVRSSHSVEVISDTTTRVGRLSLEAFEPDAEPVAMKVVQYLIKNQYGALIMAFSTTREDMMGPWGEKFFLNVVDKAMLGERPAPY